MNRLDEIKKRYTVLSAELKTEFIGYLLFYFSLSARCSYVEAGLNSESSAATLRAYNEIVQVLSKQMLVSLGAQPPNIGYPDDVFFDILKECFEHGNAPVEDFIRPIYDTFRDIFSSSKFRL